MNSRSLKCFTKKLENFHFDCNVPLGMANFPNQPEQSDKLKRKL